MKLLMVSMKKKEKKDIYYGFMTEHNEKKSNVKVLRAVSLNSS